MSEHIARLERDSAFLMGERDLLLQQLEGAPCRLRTQSFVHGIFFQLQMQLCAVSACCMLAAFLMGEGQQLWQLKGTPCMLPACAACCWHDAVRWEHELCGVNLCSVLMIVTSMHCTKSAHDARCAEVLDCARVKAPSHAMMTSCCSQALTSLRQLVPTRTPWTPPLTPIPRGLLGCSWRMRMQSCATPRQALSLCLRSCL